MEATPTLISKMSFEEYTAFDERSEFRYEFDDGQVLAMAGGTLNHNTIAGNFLTSLKPQLKQNGCRVFTENVKVEVIKGTSYRYPDVVVACHPFDLRGDNQTIRQPRLLVEVLSKSTATDDRGVKWHRYRKISSLWYYLLVDQYKVTVELLSRIEDTDSWISSMYETLEDTIVLPRLNAELSLLAIYDDVELADEKQQKVRDH